MAWMLVMALCIAAFVLVTYFGKTFRIFKKNAFVYPSAAYIDQILPPEIIESILSHTDMSTLRSCVQVSKYWRHHAEKDHVFKTVLETAKPRRVSMAELEDDLKETGIQIQWLTYNEDHYKPSWHVQDGQYINRIGKKLIDAEYSSILQIKKAFKRAPNKDGRSISPIQKYVMRTRLRFSFEMHGTYHFYDLESQEYVRFFSSAMLHIKDQLRSGTEIEIVEEMTALEGGFGSTLVLANLENVRIIEKRNFLGGIPIDCSMFAIMYMLFVPCIVKDFWNASDDTKYYMNLLLANIGLFGTIIASIVVSIDAIRAHHGPRKQRANSVVAIGILGIIFLALIFYQYAIEVGFHCTVEVGCLMYAMLVLGMPTENYPNAKRILFISFCLVVSIVDWKLTVDAVKNGAFWYSLVYNLAQHVLLSMWVLLMACINHALFNWKIDLRVLKPYKQMTQLLICTTLSALYIACAAPYTLKKTEF